jgi:hypothetical protein
MSEPADRPAGSYIGDGVYARFDGWHVWLETWRETDDRHVIALEPEVITSLVEFVSNLRKRFPMQSVPVWEALWRSVKREELRTDLPRQP